MVTRIGGLSSGIETEQVITALLEAAKVPITRLQDENTENETKISAWTTLDTKFTSLNSLTTQLSNYTTWKQKSVTVGDSTILSATAENTADAASYTVKVNTLAKAHRIGSDAQTSTTTALGYSGDFKIGGKTVNVSASDSLTAIRDSINTASASSDVAAADKVKATIIGKTLVIERANTGNTNINIQDGTNNVLQSLGIFNASAAVKNQLQDAANLSATINGVAYTGTSNSKITDAINGVSLNFTDTGTTSLDIGNDTNSIKTLIKDFLTNYNDVMSTVKTASSVTLSDSGSIDSEGLLQGDSLLASVQNKLRGLMGGIITDPSADKSFNSLYTVGIWTNSTEGKYEIVDEDKLDDALTNHFDEVMDLFRDTKYGIVKQVDRYVYSLVDPAEGLITQRTQGIQTQIDDNKKRITELQKNMVDYETDLWEHFAQMEKAVSSITTQVGNLLSALGQS